MMGIHHWMCYDETDCDQLIKVNREMVSVLTSAENISLGMCA